jgi:hypothetical protein
MVKYIFKISYPNKSFFISYKCDYHIMVSKYTYQFFDLYTNEISMHKYV